MMEDNKPKLYKFSDIEHRLHTLEPGQTYIKPFVTSAVSDTMCGGLNFLNQVSVPWELTCDEIIYCMEGTFRLTCDGESHMFVRLEMFCIYLGTIQSHTNVMKSVSYSMPPIRMTGNNKQELLLFLVLTQRTCQKIKSRFYFDS